MTSKYLDPQDAIQNVHPKLCSGRSEYTQAPVITCPALSADAPARPTPAERDVGAAAFLPTFFIFEPPPTILCRLVIH